MREIARKYKVDLDKEFKLGRRFKNAFYDQYHILSLAHPRVVFEFDNKLIEQYRYIQVEKTDNRVVVRVNPQIADLEGPKTVKENARRAALKVFLLENGHDAEETSPDYRALAATQRVYYYGDLYETPHKMALYTCSICGRPVAVYSKPRKSNDVIIGMELPPHSKTGNGTNVHTGQLSFHGVEVITNKTLQQALFFQNKMIQLIDDKTGKFEKTYYDKRERDIWF